MYLFEIVFSKDRATNITIKLETNMLIPGTILTLAKLSNDIKKRYSRNL